MASNAFADDKADLENLVSGMPAELRSREFGVRKTTAEQLLRGGTSVKWVMSEAQQVRVQEACRRAGVDNNKPEPYLLASLLQERGADVYTGYEAFDRKMSVKLLRWIQSHVQNKGKWSLNKDDTERLIIAALDMIKKQRRSYDGEARSNNAYVRETPSSRSTSVVQTTEQTSTSRPTWRSISDTAIPSNINRRPTKTDESSPQAPSRPSTASSTATQAATSSYQPTATVEDDNDDEEVEELIGDLHTALTINPAAGPEMIEVLLERGEEMLEHLQRDAKMHKRTLLQLLEAKGQQELAEAQAELSGL
ncbi:hypothetical protein Tdes44962_MAKER08247 [Teratosphaeria destructans]|uniref:Uncharacterized protein n=1 Tax=Teratosphaeria destructans TaxID=418781 RepID=A0A9W7W4Q8_9PEZI|nr:hypothetical protein Tdes44962_MAKER08247 [Teratosphaeria destructans]